ncbi:MAG: hypothetical protein EBQ92_09065 [Proteobacteria bacterium]|nr:hypothetical protein [Pseudomonadota bacterium]
MFEQIESTAAPELISVPIPTRPKGIEPRLLLKQVFNTAPFLKTMSFEEKPSLRYLQVLQSVGPTTSWDDFSWGRYFELCVSAHYATVATFVPTDVDAHIRFKLWDPSIADEDLLKMLSVIVDSFSWDTTSLSARWLKSPSGRLLEGHKGEWFSIAAAAFGASRKRFPEKAKEVLSLIECEIENEETCFLEFHKEKDYFSILKSSVLIAHNLGDLQRVLEMWKLPHLFAERMSTKTLEKAGQINRDLMAVENHRHFSLREPRALRKNIDFLLPLGPFLDDWGKKLARHPDLALEELGTIADALIQGWVRLEGPVGYARALSGLQSNYPGGIKELLKPLPSRVAKLWTGGALRQLCDISQPRFEAQWIKKCQGFLAP